MAQRAHEKGLWHRWSVSDGSGVRIMDADDPKDVNQHAVLNAPRQWIGFETTRPDGVTVRVVFEPTEKQVVVYHDGVLHKTYASVLIVGSSWQTPPPELYEDEPWIPRPAGYVVPGDRA